MNIRKFPPLRCLSWMVTCGVSTKWQFLQFAIDPSQSEPAMCNDTQSLESKNDSLCFSPICVGVGSLGSSAGELMKLGWNWSNPVGVYKSWSWPNLMEILRCRWVQLRMDEAVTGWYTGFSNVVSGAICYESQFWPVEPVWTCILQCYWYSAMIPSA